MSGQKYPAGTTLRVGGVAFEVVGSKTVTYNVLQVIGERVGDKHLMTDASIEVSGTRICPPK
ncbi:MAG: hypothetical protein LCH99_26410 [Proteobacteria bacterium]|nr:hypothetical protein [Pseudomonadota bacterium]